MEMENGCTEEAFFLYLSHIAILAMNQSDVVVKQAKRRESSGGGRLARRKWSILEM
jgi:hypothetical protein